MRRWAGSIGLAIAVAIGYFLALKLSFLLITKPDDVAAFWPAAGMAAGVLLALGPGARWPVAVGTIVASIPGNLLGNWNLGTSIIFALCNAGQVLLVAGLIQRCFGSAFSLDSLRPVLGLVTAAIAGTAVAAIGGTAGVVLVQGSTAPALTIWLHWLASNVPSILAIAPLLIGLVCAARDPPPRGEILEGVVALVALTTLSGLVIFLPREPWTMAALVALLFPFLLWLAARCRPVFAAAAAFIVALTIVWTTTFSIGMFDETNFPVADRTLAAQAAILAVSLCAIVLASLFSERRESEARLVRSNMMLQGERNHKLMNIEAITGAIVHEVRQPLAAIAVNGYAGIRLLSNTPPDLEEARAAMTQMVSDSHRASQILESVRALFKSSNFDTKWVDLNGIALETLDVLSGELKSHGVMTRTELAPDLPLVLGHGGQLQEVLLNLCRNAIDAMDLVADGARVLRVRTECDGRDSVVVSVRDSGPGIDPEKLDGIFEAFVTTKPQGMGLGLAICNMIIARHGGRISATSEKGGGALFQFTLPIKSGGGSSTVSL